MVVLQKCNLAAFPQVCAGVPYIHNGGGGYQWLYFLIVTDQQWEAGGIGPAQYQR